MNQLSEGTGLFWISWQWKFIEDLKINLALHFVYLFIITKTVNWIRAIISKNILEIIPSCFGKF